MGVRRDLNWPNDRVYSKLYERRKGVHKGLRFVWVSRSREPISERESILEEVFDLEARSHR